MPDLMQPINLREAVRIQQRIALHRRALRRLRHRAAGQDHEYTAAHLDDALAALGDAWDAMEEDLRGDIIG